MRLILAATAALCLFSCGRSSPPPAPAGDKTPVAHVKITQFYAPEPMLPKGTKGNLCYGVEHAARVEMVPPVEELWPSPVRCFDIAPKKNTSYTLTAIGDDGSKDTKTVEVTVGAPAPKLSDLSVNATAVKPGELVRVCFKVANANNVKASPGKLERSVNCVMDNPKKTTTYTITAYGGNRQEDSATVTVNVR